MEQRSTQTVNLGDEPIVDVKAIGQIIGFALRSIARRRRSVIFSVVVMTSLIAALALMMPKVYKISTRILTHKSLVMPALVSPDRAIPQSADAPTAGAVELIKSRENLENLMSDVRLKEQWEQKRSWLSKAKEKSLQAMFGPMSEVDRHEAYLKMVDERLKASVASEVVMMDVEWPDPEIAMGLAEGAIARFLKMRHDMELSEILETVTILSRNVDISRAGIEEAVAAMQKVFHRKESEIANRTGNREPVRKSKVIAFRRPIGAEQMDPAFEEIKRSLHEKQASVSSMRRAYEAKVRKAEEELAKARDTLGPEHPDLIAAKRNLEVVSKLPPELAALQVEESRLTDSLGAMPTPVAREQVQMEVHSKNDNQLDMMRLSVSDELYKQLEADPELSSILSDLRKREEAHDTLVRRLANARIESETANAAFEYRYIMTMPPVYPKKYVKPNIPLMVGGGLIVSLILSMAWAVLTELFSGKILESWQAERFLGVRLLGEIDEP